MKPLHQIKDFEAAKALMNPVRVKILDLLRAPLTCAQIAESLDMTQQRVNNHLNELRKYELISITAKNQKRNFLEAVYQATGKLYWLSPELLRPSHPSIKQLKEQMSLHNLLLMSEQLNSDAAELLSKVGSDNEVPSLGITADIFFHSEIQREEFANEYLKLMHQLIEKYQSNDTPNSDAFTAMLVCYPKPSKGEKMFESRRFILIDRPIEKVFHAFTDANSLQSWFCDEADVEPKQTGKFVFRGKSVFGGDQESFFEVFVPNQKLCFPWNFNDANGFVEINFESHLSQTRVLVSHKFDRDDFFDFVFPAENQ